MRTRSLLPGLGAAVALVLLVGWLDQAGDQPGTASSSRDSLPVVGVSIDNDRTSARTGDVLTYRTHVRNHEPTPQRFVVTHMLPSALHVVGTSPAGRTDSRQVSWTVRLAPGRSAEFTTTGRVVEPRSGYDRLTTTSCLGVEGRPHLACASDTDALVLPSRSSFGSLLLALGVVGLVAAALLGILALATGAFGPREPERSRRRTRRRLPAPVRAAARGVGATMTTAGRLALLLVAPPAASGGSTSGHRDHRRARGPPHGAG